MEPKYPEIEVQLTDTDGNALAVVGAVKKALRRGGAKSSEITKFCEDALSGNYDHVLQTCMAWVTVC